MRLIRSAVLILMLVPALWAKGLNLEQPKQTGIASWYGRREQGRTMANGKRFDRNRYTAASRTYKLGTFLAVTYPATGVTVYVMVTDRGPWIKGRKLDLSERAAQTLGLKPHGLGTVYIEPVSVDTENFGSKIKMGDHQ